MENGYQDAQICKKYLEFLNSENGRIQQEVLHAAILARLAGQTDANILDAGCGPGWLAGSLKKNFPNVQAFDASETFIKHARENYKGVEFKVASIEQELPYADNFFDSVILNMVGPDIGHLPEMFSSTCRKLKPGGQLLMTLPNPYYTEPVAEWKRTFIDFILRRKPRLKIKGPYANCGKIEREFHTTKIASYFYPLSTYLNTAREAGFKLTHLGELQSKADSKRFNLQYQLHRYPLLVLLEFLKPA